MLTSVYWQVEKYDPFISRSEILCLCSFFPFLLHDGKKAFIDCSYIAVLMDFGRGSEVNDAPAFFLLEGIEPHPHRLSLSTLPTQK